MIRIQIDTLLMAQLCAMSALHNTRYDGFVPTAGYERDSSPITNERERTKGLWLIVGRYFSRVARIQVKKLSLSLSL